MHDDVTAFLREHVKHMSIDDRLQLAKMCVEGTGYAVLNLKLVQPEAEPLHPKQEHYVVVGGQKYPVPESVDAAEWASKCVDGTAQVAIQCGDHTHANAYDKDACEALHAEVYDSASEAKAATQKATQDVADSLETAVGKAPDPGKAYAEALCEFLNEAHKGYKFKVDPRGKTYHRVVRYSMFGAATIHSSATAYCFVDKDGNIRKPAGWAKPAAGVRSTVAKVVDGQTKTDWSGGWLYA